MGQVEDNHEKESKKVFLRPFHQISNNPDDWNDVYDLIVRPQIDGGYESDRNNDIKCVPGGNPQTILPHKIIPQTHAPQPPQASQTHRTTCVFLPLHLRPTPKSH